MLDNLFLAEYDAAYGCPDPIEGLAQHFDILNQFVRRLAHNQIGDRFGLGQSFSDHEIILRMQDKLNTDGMPATVRSKEAISAPAGSAADRRLFDNLCGDFGIRIARDGTWYYRGSPIGRKPLVKLFASVLRRDDQGGYWLITPAEKGRIEVEDVPFVAVEATFYGEGCDQFINLRTNLDDIVTVDADHPLRVIEDAQSGAPAPYVVVRDRLEARLARPVYYELVEKGEARDVDGRPSYGIWSAGRFFSLGSLAGTVGA